MVLLIEKLTKHYFKLENHHHAITHLQPEELSSSLLAFKSHVSKSIDQLASDLKPGSETPLSLTWFGKCFSHLVLRIIIHEETEMQTVILYMKNRKTTNGNCNEHIKLVFHIQLQFLIMISVLITAWHYNKLYSRRD